MTSRKEPPAEQRLDKWLWSARFFKSRSLATDAVNGGKVHCNGDRTKPGKPVKPGDRLTIQKGPYEFEVVVERLSANRLPAPAARELYTETGESEQKRALRREQARADRLSTPVPDRRPNKRDRRLLLKAKQRRGGD